MLPLVFLPDTPVLLAGRGPAYDKRLKLLRGAGLSDLVLHEGGVQEEAVLHGRRLVFGAGMDRPESQHLADMARALRIPVNIEDVPDLCDLHVPAMVRRGALLLTVSTGGGAPAMAATLRAWLEDAFGEEWAGRLEEAAALRAQLRAAGRSPPDIMAAVQAHIAQACWLAPR
jgi:precorrin-2 dehydrogenase/sirohydrochlorin ferrochelatase